LLIATYSALCDHSDQMVRVNFAFMRASCTLCLVLAVAIAQRDIYTQPHEFLLAGAPSAECPDCDWTSVQDLGVNGRALFPTFPVRENYYDRLPLAAKTQVRPAVWTLSTMPAGMYCEFVTSSPILFVNVSYTSSQLSMYHFSATGVSGLDLYAWDDNASAWRFTSVTTTIIYPVSVSEMQAATHNDGSPTRYRLHLPTYNGVVSLYVGHSHAHPVLPLNRTVAKPIVWYGTSILQGAVASRPGMIFTSQISRTLGLEVLNFGFSGNGLMELNVTTFLVDVDAAMFVIDCVPNMSPDLISQNTAPLVMFLRSKHPSAPILLVGPPQYGADWIDSTLNDAKRAALQAAFSQLIADGVSNLHLVPNANDELYASFPLLSPTVEGVHPTDLGHFDVARFYIGFLGALV
jgi:hypothetical protein